MVEFKYKKHVSINVDLSVGEHVTIEGWGHKLDGKDLVIEDIKFHPGCESSVMVKVDKYDSYIDSNWLDKKQLVNS